MRRSTSFRRHTRPRFRGTPSLVRSRHFDPRVGAVAMLVVTLSAHSARAEENDLGKAIAMATGIGLTVVTGIFAMSNHDKVRKGDGSVVTGTGGMILGAPVAGIGALVFVRSLDSDTATTGEVLLGLGMGVVGTASVVYGGRSVSNARQNKKEQSRVMLSPGVFEERGEHRYGLVLSATF